MEEEKCKLKHQGGATIPSCLDYAILDYTYYYKDLRDHTAIFSLYRQFKFCPFCGKQIELPWWMVEEDAWASRYGKEPTGKKTVEELDNEINES